MVPINITGMFAGWTESGCPWASVFGFVCSTLSAFSLCIQVKSCGVASYSLYDEENTRTVCVYVKKKNCCLLNKGELDGSAIHGGMAFELHCS